MSAAWFGAGCLVTLKAMSLATNPLAQTGIFLDRHRYRRRLGTCRRQQPGTQLGEAGAAMQKCALPGDLALGIRLDASRLPSRCRRTIWHHSSYRTSLSPPGHRDAHRSLYWRSRRNSPPDERRGQPIRARVPQVLEAQEAMGGSRQAGPVRPVYDADQLVNAMKGTGLRTAAGSIVDRRGEPAGAIDCPRCPARPVPLALACRRPGRLRRLGMPSR
jgi:hypothetical protein